MYKRRRVGSHGSNSVAATLAAADGDSDYEEGGAGAGGTGGAEDSGAEDRGGGPRSRASVSDGSGGSADDSDDGSSGDSDSGGDSDSEDSSSAEDGSSAESEASSGLGSGYESVHDLEPAEEADLLADCRLAATGDDINSVTADDLERLADGFPGFCPRYLLFSVVAKNPGLAPSFIYTGRGTIDTESTRCDPASSTCAGGLGVHGIPPNFIEWVNRENLDVWDVMCYHDWHRRAERDAGLA